MKKYSILKQILGLCKKGFCFRCKGLVFEQILDVPQQMSKTFLFAKSFDQTKISTPEIAYNDTIVVFPEVVDNDFRTSAFVNVKESYIRVGEYPELVTLPAVSSICINGNSGKDYFKLSYTGVAFSANLWSNPTSEPAAIFNPHKHCNISSVLL